MLAQTMPKYGLGTIIKYGLGTIIKYGLGTIIKREHCESTIDESHSRLYNCAN